MRRTRSRPECDFPTCAVACVCSCSLENPQSKACGKNLGKTWVKLRFCAIFKQQHWKKRRIFILSWLWAQKNVCHSRTKCKFSIFLSILLGVFEAQVTVDRSRAVILQFCYDNGLGDRGGQKSVIPALQLTHSGTGVKETQTLKCCGKKKTTPKNELDSSLVPRHCWLIFPSVLQQSVVWKRSYGMLFGPCFVFFSSFFGGAGSQKSPDLTHGLPWKVWL